MKESPLLDLRFTNFNRFLLLMFKSRAGALFISNGIFNVLWVDHQLIEYNWGKSKKISLTQREFLFNILKQNQAKFQYMLDELSPRDFVATYMKLIPYIVAMRHLQQFDVSEVSRDEVKEIVKDITDGD